MRASRLDTICPMVKFLPRENRYRASPPIGSALIVRRIAGIAQRVRGIAAEHRR
jgi:hypothetical protein